MSTHDESKCDKCGEMDDNQNMMICGGSSRKYGNFYACGRTICEDCSNGSGPDKEFTCGDASDGLNSYITDDDICSECLPIIIRELRGDEQ